MGRAAPGPSACFGMQHTPTAHLQAPVPCNSLPPIPNFFPCEIFLVCQGWVGRRATQAWCAPAPQDVSCGCVAAVGSSASHSFPSVGGFPLSLSVCIAKFGLLVLRPASYLLAQKIELTMHPPGSIVTAPHFFSALQRKPASTNQRSSLGQALCMRAM